MIPLGSKWVLTQRMCDLPEVYNVAEELTLANGDVYYRFDGTKVLWIEKIIRDRFMLVVKSKSYKKNGG